MFITSGGFAVGIIIFFLFAFLDRLFLVWKSYKRYVMILEQSQKFNKDSLDIPSIKRALQKFVKQQKILDTK